MPSAYELIQTTADRGWSVREAQMFVEWCEDNGVWFWDSPDVAGPYLRYCGPARMLDGALRIAVTRHRREILHWLHVRVGQQV